MLFSYYGGKSKLAHLYPAPTEDWVIEPFAGGASYSLRHCERSVILNDLDPTTVGIWRLMLDNPVEAILARVPPTVEEGTLVADLAQGHPGMEALIASQARMGSQGMAQNVPAIGEWGALHWHRFRDAIAYWHPRIQHWQVQEADYKFLKPWKATWFIDPPYSTKPGSLYRTCLIDFDELRAFVLKLPGQVIVCDDVSATYLPFKELRRTISSGAAPNAPTMEGIYVQSGGVDITDAVNRVRPESFDFADIPLAGTVAGTVGG